VDNDVNLAALGEHWFGARQNTQNMIVMAVGTGIGAGIIVDGALYRGSREASGEIGQMIPGREFFGTNYVDFGALESIASGTGIAQRARESQRNDSIFAEDVFKAARLGQAWALDIVSEEVDYLAIAIGNLAVFFDPELIVLGGGVSNSADLLIEPILHRLKDMLPTLPKLVASSLGPRATVMGAITKVLHQTSNFYLVRKLG
jgi:glucokinase